MIHGNGRSIFTAYVWSMTYSASPNKMDTYRSFRGGHSKIYTGDRLNGAQLYESQNSYLSQGWTETRLSTILST
ncbi:hypothetical protein BABINDRAFT_163815, partial [Babjeviella inositovora NRRL Y-12698]